MSLVIELNDLSKEFRLNQRDYLQSTENFPPNSTSGVLVGMECFGNAVFPCVCVLCMHVSACSCMLCH